MLHILFDFVIFGLAVVMVLCPLFQIDSYEKIYEECELITAVNIIDQWFRIDGKPFKQALLNIIKKWSFMFKQHLIDHVTNR